ncbi:pentatricopeptide repeat-containing protein At5g39710 [Argentina anserina]|uniref:pentatricopeptide repeat-containing protein At5g39710 n=1 Tax=Argentina anserina TaxID=57926 RepID=UPI002176329B|nr:pentatricopeptide repeat-containing protein At5g39710 [Potentilla anserina]XP_050377336.1 pentatricopeptide repeat-containing protein At5g39710 [Potentilla anserina]
MSLRYLVSRQSKFTPRLSSHYSTLYGFTTLTDTLPISIPPTTHVASKPLLNPRNPIPMVLLNRGIHSAQVVDSVDSEAEEEGDVDEGVNEFLSRFVWIMRQKLNEAYPGCDKETVNGMLLVIVQKVVEKMEGGGFEEEGEGEMQAVAASEDFSEDLWRTVWEVSERVVDEMRKEARKERLKGFLHEKEVKEMCRFAGEVGIRGDMLRELRFKWAREKLEETEFYEGLEGFRGNVKAKEEEDVEDEEEAGGTEVKAKVDSLPKRRGKIRYNIYGLDLSDPKWVEVADKIYEASEILSPEEPKPISGKCKLVTEKILQSNEADDLCPLLAEWAELLQPSRADWVDLLDKLKKQNPGLYMKVAELVLDEKSFQTSIHDYSKLLDAYAKENHLEDVERILKKMTKNGVEPDYVIATILVHMHSKAGNLEGAQQALETLRSQGFRPDIKVYDSMIKAYANANDPKSGEALITEMQQRNIQPTKEMCMAVLRSFAQRGDVGGAGRIVQAMLLAGVQPTLESSSVLVEAYAKAGDPDQARYNFDSIIKLGHKPDDKSTGSMIAAYAKKNLLDKALELLLQLEKDGFEPGVATYTVLVDWLGKLQLVKEAEQLLDKIARLGEAPPFQLHVSICDMYARAGVEKKALQALGVLEAKKEQLSADEFDRIIRGLTAGGFFKDAERIRGLMEAQGFSSDQLKMLLMGQRFIPKRPSMR